MKREKIFYCAGIIWEIARFLLFFLLISYVYFQPLPGGNRTILWILFLSSSQLLMPAAYTLLLFNSIKFHVVIQLLRIGKIISLLPSLLIFFDEFLFNFSLFTVPLSSVSLYRKGILLFLSISIFFDLIFLYFLLSYKKTGKEPDEIKGESSHLPDYTVTEVKNEFLSENSEDE